MIFFFQSVFGFVFLFLLFLFIFMPIVVLAVCFLGVSSVILDDVNSSASKWVLTVLYMENKKKMSDNILFLLNLSVVN